MRHRHRGRLPLADSPPRAKLPFFDAGNKAKGFIAVGNIAHGVFAFGNVAVGSVFAMGNVAIGLVAIGNVAVSPVTAIAATIGIGGVLSRAGVLGLGCASTRWLDSVGIHVGTMLDVPLPLGFLVAPIVWTAVAKSFAPERSIFLTKARVEHLEKRESENRHRFDGRVLEVREEGGAAIYVVDAGGEKPAEIHGRVGLAKIGDDVIVKADTERVEAPTIGDYRSAAAITERLVSTSVRVVPPKGEPDENHALAVWYSRAFVIGLIAIPLGLVLLALR